MCEILLAASVWRMDWGIQRQEHVMGILFLLSSPPGYRKTCPHLLRLGVLPLELGILAYRETDLNEIHN